MAILSFVEIYPNRGGKTGAIDEDTRTFRVVTDAGTDNKYEILKDSRCPKRGSAHTTEPFLFCKDVDVLPDTSVRSPRHWIVKAHYDNQPLTGVPQFATAITLEPDPLKRQVEIEGRSLINRRARTLGLLIETTTLAAFDNLTTIVVPDNYTPIVNTAGDPFTGLEEDEPIWILDCTINAASVQDWVRTYQGCLNLNEVSIRGYSGVFRPLTLMLKDWRHSKLLSEKLPSGPVVNYFQTFFGLHYKRRRWITPVRNEGWYANSYVDGVKRKREVLDRGARPKTKTLLNIDGAPLDNPTEANALYRFYADGPAVDYSVFNLSL